MMRPSWLLLAVVAGLLYASGAMGQDTTTTLSTTSSSEAIIPPGLQALTWPGAFALVAWKVGSVCSSWAVAFGSGLQALSKWNPVITVRVDRDPASRTRHDDDVNR